MNHDHSQGGMGKHMLLMIICCAVPLVLVGAVSLLGLSLGPLQGLVPYVAALMCPLMMILMMRGMMQDHGTPEGHQHHTTTQRNDASSPVQIAEANASSEQKNCHQGN